MAKLTDAITVVAAGQALTGTLTAVTSSVTKVADLTSATLWVDYTRNGGSVTGRPILAVELSRDARSTATASVAHWSRVPVTDGSSLAAGSLETYQESRRFNPTLASGTYHWPGIDVTGANWLRVLVADVDAGNSGTLGVFLTGEAIR